MLNKKRNLCIGLVTLPIGEGGLTPLSNIVDILSSISNNLCITTGNKASIFAAKNYNKKIHIDLIKYKSGRNISARVIKYVYMQLKFSHKLLKRSKNVNMWLFLGGDLLLPMLIVKLLGQDVTLVLTGSAFKTGKVSNDFLAKPVAFLHRGTCTLADRIILYSPNLIKEWNLEKHKHKISIAHEHFLDFDKLTIKKKIDERENLVGYIGRLSEEKGVLNFVKAIPEILKKRNDVKFLIGGDGQLRDEIEKYVSKENLNDKVKLVGWIPHDKLPDYMNELKLVVLPSYTEGLPNIMLEAMACGTSVLATPVGAIPDVIKDEKTGFIMENNSPECIAENVMRALEHPNLDEITKNVRELVENEFTYEAAVEGYRKILKELS